ncbi:hypothetical protein PsAD2_04626 [Pseudovibrio axinellae]|uniref:DUF3168 domain-containing protein n=1 Tax=Pseudovibrio axinellae TaxID=989403 RepID=A0A161UGA1_9HYPH|nr:DUF3168 domain-containing protein [Pseudovibrio axinellae]KZL04543.1 hypothetical protein PsAD2_04626 [Pseudovibrio axinellae]SEQ73704.1 Protein of unknown function [Pseudovibrio axinellae]
MGSPDLELQKAVVAALSADETVLEFVHDVFDSVKVPSDQANSPWGVKDGYVSLGAEMNVPARHDGFLIEETTLQIDCWSRKTGRVHVKQIMAAVRAVLDGAELPLPSYGNVISELSLHTITPDPETGVTHGVLHFSFEIQVH